MDLILKDTIQILEFLMEFSQIFLQVLTGSATIQLNVAELHPFLFCSMRSKSQHL